MRLRDDENDEWLREARGNVPALLWMVPLAVTMIAIASHFIPNIFYRMGLVNALLLPLTLMVIQLPWRRLWRVGAKPIMVGIVAALLLYLLGLGGFHIMSMLFPDIAQESTTLFAWKDLLPLPIALSLLLLAVLGEEVFWRAGVTLPLVERLGAWSGCAISALLYGVAHIAAGPPLLAVAAFTFGFFWSVVLLRSRSLTASFLSHLLWDIMVIYMWGYG